MPVVLRIGPYRFKFYGSDKDEPAHVHVQRDSSEAKFWIYDTVQLESNTGYAPHELNEVQRLTEENQAFLLEKWDEFFGD
jgi:hypothetical protein